MLTAGPPPDAAIFRPLAPSAADASGISLCIRRVKPRKTPQLLRLSRIPTATPHNPPPDLPCGGSRLRLTQGHSHCRRFFGTQHDRNHRSGGR
ncbi:hypothetical protein SJA_C1-10810 [Sphingobium indicum UT26S]|uniref:Uncharacterized protein n=1 Tax=Sphingobium indicum (strain DSM 16413 / CCM 7287 / MTCC 6362 / UT26 / NBRC 101211 / UT26S) TaxID=452662 RepID=D4YZY3_SPHIU|nr:hypothetical protein SJA_C1-10810 [Sphingobium indicum UT26S]